MKDLDQQLMNSLIGLDPAAPAGDSTAIWQTPDWGAFEYKALMDRFNELSEREKRELYLPQYHGDRYRGLDLKRHAEFDPIKERVPMLSLCDMMYALAQFDREYFDLIDRDYQRLDNPFEMQRYVGQFHGVDIRDATQRGGLGFPMQKRDISVYVTMPNHTGWNAFECLDNMLYTGPVRHGRGLGQFLHIMSRYGWFERGAHDIHVSARVKARSAKDIMSQWGLGYGGSYSDRQRESNWELEDVTVSVGDWSFTQYPNGLPVQHSRRLASYGYRDQIAIRKSNTKGMEQIHLYLDGRGDYQPLYDIYRDNELDGLIGGDAWTEKELRLAEMLDIRGEIFLDKPDQFPILGVIRQLTPDALVGMDNIRRAEIFSKFGEGTIKIPKA